MCRFAASAKARRGDELAGPDHCGGSVIAGCFLGGLEVVDSIIALPSRVSSWGGSRNFLALSEELH